jgi:hypothetical protein
MIERNDIRKFLINKFIIPEKFDEAYRDNSLYKMFEINKFLYEAVFDENNLLLYYRSYNIFRDISIKEFKKFFKIKILQNEKKETYPTIVCKCGSFDNFSIFINYGVTVLCNNCNNEFEVYSS